MTLRPIRVIADDYALSPGVSDGILDLARAGRLSGTGAMVPSPRWKADAVRLLDTPDGFATGLHLTLTGALSPLGPMPSLCPGGRFPTLSRWLALSHAGLLSSGAAKAELAAEIGRQLDAFEDAMGRAPHFVDGHQHLHLLPGIRPLLLDAITRRYAPGTVWLRDCAEPAGRILHRGVTVGKALFIAALARGLAAQAAARAIPTNRGFAGIYGFIGDFPALMARFLDGSPAGGVIMVHPARRDTELASLDPVVGARLAEMDYLAGPTWPDALSHAGIFLG
ncbi:ChbG/HpnK family deacetylase [Niveispirillum sp. KHB5.9]|uniref:ChbG/HpnK family deacetylase n=1 Tax=Niveispirillum sp. KHB5.9 TaxID=3400269 RepID=UPI003A883DB5